MKLMSEARVGIRKQREGSAFQAEEVACPSGSVRER